MLGGKNKSNNTKKKKGEIIILYIYLLDGESP